MMGEHARQNELWSEPVNLARRIPADHPLRKLRETLKLDFVREVLRGIRGQGANLDKYPLTSGRDGFSLLASRRKKLKRQTAP